jgi:hypothetical protein
VADCGWARRRRAGHAIAAAFRDAFEESGLPPHPGGECPSADCRCEELADSIGQRAVRLAAERLGIPVADLVG